MSVEFVLAIFIPIGFIVILALLFKFVPRAFHYFWGQNEDKMIGLDVEGGVMLSPEPYHMTWPTPDSKMFSPFGDDTPKAARPPQSPRVMTSLISPIKTVCSPPKRLQQGQKRRQHSPVVVSDTSNVILAQHVEVLKSCGQDLLYAGIVSAFTKRKTTGVRPESPTPRTVSVATRALEYLSPNRHFRFNRRETGTKMLSFIVVICCALVLLLFILAVKYYYKFLPRTRAVQPPSITLMGINDLPSENTIEFLTSYHLARPTPVSKTHTLSPIREESWMSVKSFTSSLTLGDSIPKSPVILTSLVSPLDNVLSPPPALVTPLPAVGFV